MSDDEEPSLDALARAYVEALGMLYVPGLDKIAVQSFNALGAKPTLAETVFMVSLTGRRN